MKFLTITLLLVFAFLIPQQKSEVFDCVVTEVKDASAVTVCEIPSNWPECGPGNTHKDCISITRDIPLDEWPRVWPKAEKGVVVHAQWVDGKLQPYSCQPEQVTGTYRRVDLNGGGAVARREKELICSREPSAFIRELLKELNP